MDAAVVSICKVEAGTAFNSIADEARMGGTVRTLSRASQDATQQRLRDIVTGVAASLGATAELHYERGYPALHTPADLYDNGSDTEIRYVGPDRFFKLHSQGPGGNDSSRYNAALYATTPLPANR